MLCSRSTAHQGGCETLDAKHKAGAALTEEHGNKRIKDQWDLFICVFKTLRFRKCF